MSDVFISYSRKDAEFVRRLHVALAKADRNVWVDWEDIPPTAEWLREINSAIETANSFAFVITPDSVASAICMKEVAHAVTCNKRLIPLVHREVDSATVPAALAKLNWIFFRDSDAFESSVHALLAAIDTDLDWVRTHTRLLTRASEWESSGQEKSLVLRGHHLKEAEDWLAHEEEKEPAPAAIHTRYIFASRRAESKRQRIVLTSVTFGLVVSAILTVVAFYYFVIAEDRREIALSRQLAAQASTHIADRYDLALLLSIEAHRARSTFAARDMLLKALQSRPRLATFLQGNPVTARQTSDGQQQIDSVRFDPETMRVIVTRPDNRLLVWDLENPHTPLDRPQLSWPQAWRNVVVSPDLSLLAGSTPEGVQLLDAHSGDPVAVLRHDYGYCVLAFSPNGKVLAAGSEDGIISLWDIGTRQRLFPPLTVSNRAGGIGELKSVVPFTWFEFDPHGKILIARTGDTALQFWDVATGLPSALKSPPAKVKRGVLHPDGKTFAGITGRGVLELWNLDTGERIKQRLVKRDIVVSVFSELAFSPDGNILAVGSGRNITLWEVTHSQGLVRANGEPLQAHSGEVSAMAFSSNSELLASAGADGALIIWRIRGEIAIKREFPAERPSSIAYAPDGQTLAVVDDAGVTLFETSSYTPVGPPITVDGVDIVSVAFSPDGQTLALGCSSETVHLWDVTSRSVIGPRMQARRRRGRAFVSVSFSPDGKLLATGSADRSLILWDLVTYKEQDKPLADSLSDLRPIRTLSFSPDGKVLIAGGAEDSNLWNVQTHAPLQSFLEMQDRPSRVMALANNGRILAGSTGHGVSLWDLTSGKRLSQLLSGKTRGSYVSDEATGIAFDADDRLLAMCTDDDGLALWDIEARQLLGEVLSQARSGAGYMRGLAFNRHSGHLAVAESRAITLWDLDPDAWSKLACKVANRNLSREEWRQYFPEDSYRKTCVQLPIDPAFIEEAQELAKHGRIAEAVAEFNNALALEPGLSLDPARESSRFAALGLLEQSEELAQAGDINAAVEKFSRAQQLDASLDFDPKVRANRNAALGLVAGDLALRGIIVHDSDVKAGLEAYAAAQALDETVYITPQAWNELCWHGGLNGLADEILFACDHAVQGIPDSGAFKGSRALARAQTGDLEGAIDDLEHYLMWGHGRRTESELQAHAAWLTELKSGRNPFDDQTLKKLRMF